MTTSAIRDRMTTLRLRQTPVRDEPRAYRLRRQEEREQQEQNTREEVQDIAGEAEEESLGEETVEEEPEAADEIPAIEGADMATNEQANDEVDIEETVMEPYICMRHWHLLASLLVALAAILRGSWAMNTAGASTRLTKSTRGPLPPCFLSNPTSKDADGDDNDEDCCYGWCDDSKERIPCPEKGTCVNGELVSCQDSYHVVSEAADQCILSEKSNKTISQVHTFLGELTTNHYCSLEVGRMWTAIDVSSKLFDISLLVGPSHELHDHFKSNSGFIVNDDGNGNVQIGLSDQHPFIPLTCRLRISCIRFMERNEERVVCMAVSAWHFVRVNPFAVVFAVAILTTAVIGGLVSFLLRAST